MGNVLGLVAFGGTVGASAIATSLLWRWGQRRSAVVSASVALAIFALGMAYFLNES